VFVRYLFGVVFRRASELAANLVPGCGWIPSGLRAGSALDVSMDELLGPGRRDKKGRKPSRKILRRLEQIETLPKTQQSAVLKTIDNALELHTLKTGTR
jgi:hypothetical protein